MGIGLLLLRRSLLGSPEGTDGTLLASQGIVCYTVKTQSEFAKANLLRFGEGLPPRFMAAGLRRKNKA